MTPVTSTPPILQVTLITTLVTIIAQKILKRKINNELIIEAIKESNNNKFNDELAQNKILFMRQT
jgi:hypothetical protein